MVSGSPMRGKQQGPCGASAGPGRPGNGSGASPRCDAVADLSLHVPWLSSTSTRPGSQRFVPGPRRRAGFQGRRQTSSRETLWLWFTNTRISTAIRFPPNWGSAPQSQRPKTPGPLISPSVWSQGAVSSLHSLPACLPRAGWQRCFRNQELLVHTPLMAGAWPPGCVCQEGSGLCSDAGETDSSCKHRPGPLPRARGGRARLPFLLSVESGCVNSYICLHLPVCLLKGARSQPLRRQGLLRYHFSAYSNGGK